MLILFGSNYGKDTSELESSYLVWIIEKYDGAEWTLIQACKQELSARLKIDWLPKSDEQRYLETALSLSTKQVTKLLAQIDLLEKCLIMASCFGASRISVDGYLQNQKLLEQNLQLIKNANE
jgi:hypothetical protein